MSRSTLLLAPTSELFVRWQRYGDRRARGELVERFLPLARKLAARYRGRAGEPFDDLLQVASLGLLKAVDRFDPKRRTSFTSFAVPTILGELKRYFRDTGWSAHVPRGAQEFALRVQEAQRVVSARTGRSPTTQELAQYLEVSLEQVIDGLEAVAAHHSTSLDAPLDEVDGESCSLADMLGKDDLRLELVQDSTTIAAAASALSPRQRQVLALRFNEDLTQAEIAERVGVSQMQVSRILLAAISRLRELANPPASTQPGPPGQGASMPAGWVATNRERKRQRTSRRSSLR